VDLAIWETQYGTPALAVGATVPEPSMLMLALAALLLIGEEAISTTSRLAIALLFCF